MSYTPNELFSLRGRTALVTGSSRGIGAAIAQTYAAAGAHVVVHGHTAASTEKTVDLIESAGGSCTSIAGDLARPGEGRTLVEQSIAINGVLDILCINASAQINATLENLNDQDFSTQIDVNLRASIDMLQSALPAMAANGWGRVVNIGSINQDRPKAVVTAYAATKAALHNIVKSQAREYAKTGVLLNTLAPGLIDTDRNAERKQRDPKAWLEYTQTVNWMGRAGASEDLVGAALLLASDACCFMTGETIMATGGG